MEHLEDFGFGYLVRLLLLLILVHFKYYVTSGEDLYQGKRGEGL